MTQERKPRFPFAKLVLAAGVVMLGAAIGVSLVHQGASPGHGAAAAASAGTPDQVGALEARTAANPDDGEGWTALGAAYFELGRFDDAVRAYQAAAKALPARASVWSALGEAEVMASTHEPMPAGARAAFGKALSLDPKDPRARYFAAVEKDLAGDHAGAIADWLALLAETPPGAPWEQDLKRTIEQVGKINRIEVAARIDAASRAPSRPKAAIPAVPGPTPQDLAAASSIPPSQQRAMAEAMVARLDQRLRGAPGDIDGWVMLMRSRKTLGEDDKARRALGDAIAANPAAAERLRAEARALGIS